MAGFFPNKFRLSLYNLCLISHYMKSMTGLSLLHVVIQSNWWPAIHKIKLCINIKCSSMVFNFSCFLTSAYGWSLMLFYL